MDVLTIQNLKKNFGSKEVLCGLDLSVPEHSIFGFIGKKRRRKNNDNESDPGSSESGQRGNPCDG